jgi:hypothetical protein
MGGAKHEIAPAIPFGSGSMELAPARPGQRRIDAVANEGVGEEILLTDWSDEIVRNGVG